MFYGKCQKKTTQNKEKFYGKTCVTNYIKSAAGMTEKNAQGKHDAQKINIVKS